MKNYKLEVEINGLPTLPNANTYRHWTIKFKSAQKWKNLVFNKFYGHGPENPLKKAKITYIRFSAKKPDYDNCVASFKACQDGLKMAKIIIDDSWDNIISIYGWEKSPRGKGKIKIIVESVD